MVIFGMNHEGENDRWQRPVGWHDGRNLTAVYFYLSVRQNQNDSFLGLSLPPSHCRDLVNDDYDQPRYTGI